jgi:NAD(P)-dependent dehydrogenase (short-subunit alcohol dehydrogenase family)
VERDVLAKNGLAKNVVAKTCLVTGGAGGIGAAICERLAAGGSHVVVADFDNEAGSAVAKRIGGDFVSVDLRDRDSVSGAVSAVAAAHGSLSTVVNCAGVTKYADFFDITDDDWQWMMNINALGTMRMMQAAAQAMRESGGGSIVNVASIAAKGYRQTSNAAYAASKGAVIALTRVAAIQLAPYGIRVNAVCPGPTSSPLLNVHDTPETRGRIEAMVNAVPLKKFSEPDDIARAVEYLASAGNVTGQSMNVDGGLEFD